MLIHRLQDSLVKRWLWQTYQHDETGRVVMRPIWDPPGRRWQRVPFGATDFDRG